MQLSFDFHYSVRPATDHSFQSSVRLFLLKCGSQEMEQELSTQLALEFPITHLKIIPFRSSRTNVYLDYHISDLLRDVPDIWHACDASENQGFCW